MMYNSDIHHRHSIRLKGYDYSQTGMYFITICVHDKVHLFGEIFNHKMILNSAGEIAKKCWLEIPNHYPNVILHEYVIMPNHVHGIIEIINAVGVQNFEPLPPQKNRYQKIIPCSIGSIIRGFKIGVTKWFHKNTNIIDLWQRNYYEHIIRNEKSHNNISEYIINNPINWQKDRFYEEKIFEN
jgi:putative transposase